MRQLEHRFQTLFLVLILTGLMAGGCQSAMGSRAVRAAAAEEESDKSDAWVHSAGDVARTEHTLEEIHDPLGLRKYFMSEKAREIERNVGIGD